MPPTDENSDGVQQQCGGGERLLETFRTQGSAETAQVGDLHTRRGQKSSQTLSSHAKHP